MRKKKEKCNQIYDENKTIVYWYLKRRCTWLSENDIHDIMLVVWEELSLNIDEVYSLKKKDSQAAWVLAVAHKQAEKLEGKETNEEER